jgi:hypothetical protein
MNDKNRINVNIYLEKKLKTVKKLLENINKIMILLKPLIEKVLQSEEAIKYRENGTFEKAASLFGEISNNCKEIGCLSFSEDFLRNLKN